MRFINRGEPKQIRQEDIQGYYWVLLRNGESIELPEEEGKAYGLEQLKVTESKIGPIKVETKQFEDSFESELLKIKGIAKKTAEDIMEVFTKEGLIDHIKQNKKLPFRDDISKKLEKEYGK